jgi:ATP dependent DNA ligase domain
MPRVFKRWASQAIKSSRSRRDAPLPQFVHPQLSQRVEKPPSGVQWVHEIKLDGYRMAARIDNGRVQLLTRTGLDCTAKYPGAVAALADLNVKTAYLDGELCGVDDAGLPSFAQTQAATDGERGVHLVYYAFDLLHLGGWDISSLGLIERKTPRRHGDARQGSRRSPAPPRPAGAQVVASERRAAPQHALRLTARSVPRPLGRAEACRRDYIFDLDGRQPLAAHGLCRAAGGQAGGLGSA